MKSMVLIEIVLYRPVGGSADEPDGPVLATVLVLMPVQFAAQLAITLRILSKKTAYKTMALCWVTCLVAYGFIQHWRGAGLAAFMAAFTTVAWWRHRKDDDEDGPRRRRRRIASSVRSRLPRPVPVARPAPTES